MLPRGLCDKRRMDCASVAATALAASFYRSGKVLLAEPVLHLAVRLDLAAIEGRGALNFEFYEDAASYTEYAFITYCCTIRCVLKNEPFSAMAWRMT